MTKRQQLGVWLENLLVAKKADVFLNTLLFFKMDNNYRVGFFNIDVSATQSLD